MLSLTKRDYVASIIVKKSLQTILSLYVPIDRPNRTLCTGRITNGTMSAATGAGESKTAKLVRRLSWSSLKDGAKLKKSVESLVDWELDVLEAPLKVKTDLIDDLSILWPLNQQIKAPGIVVIGAQGAGKSSVLQLLTGMPFIYCTGSDSTKRPIKMNITTDPTTDETYTLVSTVDPECSPEDGNTKHVKKLEELSRFLAHLNENPEHSEVEARKQPIYVKVVRPSGAAYSVMDLPGINEEDPESVRFTEDILHQDPSCVILVVLPLTDIFDRAFPVALAKRVDPEGRRTIGVVTKTDLVQKDMDAVEKVQMTSQPGVNLPLGYIAVRSAAEKEKNESRRQILQREQAFFTSNPLLAGLRPERWGSTTLKRLVVDCQSNAIGQSIPKVTRFLHKELQELDNEEEKAAEALGWKDRGQSQGRAKPLSNHQDFFTKLCLDANTLGFEIGELALSSSTRQERHLNLGARLAAAITFHENEARRALPASVAEKVGSWLDVEGFASSEPRIYVSRETMSHDVFRKSIREVCGPVLMHYATALLTETGQQLEEVTHVLVQEKFTGFPWLVQSLKHEVTLLLGKKKVDTEKVLQRIVTSEMNWCFLSEADLNAVEREVALNMAGKSSGGLGMGKVAPAEEAKGSGLHWSAEMSDVLSPSTRAEEGGKLSRFDPTREARMRELTLDAYVRLMLRRVFYAVPMNIRNVMLNEFRHELVSMVAEKYNDEAKLRTVMSEELWRVQQRQQRTERKESLTDLLHKLDLLS